MPIVVGRRWQEQAGPLATMRLLLVEPSNITLLVGPDYHLVHRDGASRL